MYILCILYASYASYFLAVLMNAYAYRKDGATPGQISRTMTLLAASSKLFRGGHVGHVHCIYTSMH